VLLLVYYPSVKQERENETDPNMHFSSTINVYSTSEIKILFTLRSGLIYFTIWSHLLHDLVSFNLRSGLIYFTNWSHLLYDLVSFTLRSGLIYFNNWFYLLCDLVSFCFTIWSHLLYDLVSFNLQSGVIYFTIWPHLLYDLVLFTLRSGLIYFTIWSHGIIFSRWRWKSKDWKAKQFKVLGAIKTKGSKQDRQNRLRSPMPEGGEP
jgi:hypothetical protein